MSEYVYTGSNSRNHRNLIDTVGTYACQVEHATSSINSTRVWKIVGRAWDKSQNNLGC